MSDRRAAAIRPARLEDLDALVAFEIAIARASFSERAVVDRALHARRVAAALEDPREGTFVHAPAGEAHGWVWISLRENALTGERYGYLRSVAVAPEAAERTGLAQALVERATAFATERGMREVVGKVHVENVAMRVIFRETGFAPQHLTMRRRLAAAECAGA
jgi:ribosomal protein S18 acetylase RimI-like enzyme